MRELFSKGKDCAWLAGKLKNEMGGNVSFNKYGIENSVLTGVYSKDITTAPYYKENDVWFYIKYLKNEFLRIQIDIDLNKTEEIAIAMEALIKALAKIKQDETFIGLPLAIYKTGDSLTCEYAFKKVKEVVDSLKDNNMFDDGDVEYLTLLRNSRENSSIEVKSSKETTIKVLCKSICENRA